MIFMYIFCYLDDRDVEEMRKNNGENIGLLVVEYWFYVFLIEYCDVKFE